MQILPMPRNPSIEQKPIAQEVKSFNDREIPLGGGYLAPIKKHRHNFITKGDIRECECGKKILKFIEMDNISLGIRKNGRTFSKKSDQNRFFKPDEWERFEDALKPNMKHVCKCLFHTGARINEMRLAKVEDFIYNPQGRSNLILRHTKTKAMKGEFGEGKPRTIPLSKSFAKYLADWVISNNKQQKDGFNIPTTSAVKQAMKKAAIKIGLSHPEDFSAHTLRKTMEVWYMALGVESLPLVAHLGHNLMTASTNYVSPDIFSHEEKNKMRRILGDLYLRQ